MVTLEIPLRIGSFLPGGYIRALNSGTLRKGTMALEHIGSNLAIATEQFCEHQELPSSLRLQFLHP